MTTLRHFQHGDMVRHLAGGWTGRVLYSSEPRMSGPAFVRVAWTDDHRPSTERAEDLDFAEREAA